MNPADIAYGPQMGSNDPWTMGGMNLRAVSPGAVVDPVNASLQSGTALGGVGGSNNQPLGLGMNIPTMNLALGGLQTIGNIWNAWQANKLAKKQFAYQKDVTETNLANQIQSYNTALADRSRSRAHVEGQSPEQAAAYVAENSLRRR